MIKGKFSAFKNRLTTVGDEEPLNKLSLVMIIILDLFILTVLFQGLDDHTRQLTSPGEYMPYTVRQVFIDQTWTPTTRISKLQDLILSDRNNYSYRYDSIFESGKIESMHPLCRDFYEKAKRLSEDQALQDLFIDRQRYIKDRTTATAIFNKAKDAYDTRLLENISEKETSTEDVRSISKQAKASTAQIESLTSRISQTEKQINAHPGIQALWTVVSPANQNRQQVVDDFRKFERGYPLKELGWQLLFILPIFFVFYAWSSRSVKKGNQIQTLISSHLLVIASLPIILKIIEVVLDLIPNHFFKNLFKVLESLHLIAIWHYMVIFGAIALGLFLVYFIQKKVFNKQKVMQKRLMKGACVFCNKKLPAHTSSCPFCGSKQLEPCGNCHQETPIGGPYCIHCGTSVDPRS